MDLRLGERGANVLLQSDVPLGAGLSSSAAIEVATMHALSKKVLTSLIAEGHHFIGPVRITSVAYRSPSPRQPGTRGRPPKYGEKVVLAELFKDLKPFVARSPVQLELTYKNYTPAEMMSYSRSAMPTSCKRRPN